MWHEGTKYKKKLENVNEIYKLLEGELEDKEAKISLAKFLPFLLTIRIFATKNLIYLFFNSLVAFKFGMFISGLFSKILKE